MPDELIFNSESRLVTQTDYNALVAKCAHLFAMKEAEYMRAQSAEVDLQRVVKERDEALSRLDEFVKEAEARIVRRVEQISELESRLDSAESMLAIWRAAEAKRREGDHYEIRLDDDGALDEIVGSGMIHLEQMDTNEWFLELAGCALWISGKKVTMRARDYESWAEAQKQSVVERQAHK